MAQIFESLHWAYKITYSYVKKSRLPWRRSSKESACQYLPVQETWVWSLGWEDPLEKEMANHSSILAWRIPRTEKSSRLQSTGSQRVGHDWATSPPPPPPLPFSMSRSHHLLRIQINFQVIEYWSGLPFPSPGDLPDPGIEPGFPALEADALTSEPPGKPIGK